MAVARCVMSDKAAVAVFIVLLQILHCVIMGATSTSTMPSDTTATSHTAVTTNATEEGNDTTVSSAYYDNSTGTKTTDDPTTITDANATRKIMNTASSDSAGSTDNMTTSANITSSFTASVTTVSSTSIADSNTCIIVGVVTGVAVITTVAILLVIFLRKHRRQQLRKVKTNKEGRYSSLLEVKVDNYDKSVMRDTHEMWEISTGANNYQTSPSNSVSVDIPSEKNDKKNSEKKRIDGETKKTEGNLPKAEQEVKVIKDSETDQSLNARGCARANSGQFQEHDNVEKPKDAQDDKPESKNPYFGLEPTEEHEDHTLITFGSEDDGLHIHFKDDQCPYYSEIKDCEADASATEADTDETAQKSQEEKKPQVNVTSLKISPKGSTRRSGRPQSEGDYHEVTSDHDDKTPGNELHPGNGSSAMHASISLPVMPMSQSGETFHVSSSDKENKIEDDDDVLYVNTTDTFSLEADNTPNTKPTAVNKANSKSTSKSSVKYSDTKETSGKSGESVSPTPINTKLEEAEDIYVNELPVNDEEGYYNLRHFQQGDDNNDDKKEKEDDQDVYSVVHKLPGSKKMKENEDEKINEKPSRQNVLGPKADQAGLATGQLGPPFDRGDDASESPPPTADKTTDSDVTPSRVMKTQNSTKSSREGVFDNSHDYDLITSDEEDDEPVMIDNVACESSGSYLDDHTKDQTHGKTEPNGQVNPSESGEKIASEENKEEKKMEEEEKEEEAEMIDNVLYVSSGTVTSDLNKLPSIKHTAAPETPQNFSHHEDDDDDELVMIDNVAYVSTAEVQNSPDDWVFHGKHEDDEGDYQEIHIQDEETRENADNGHVDDPDYDVCIIPSDDDEEPVMVDNKIYESEDKLTKL